MSMRAETQELHYYGNITSNKNRPGLLYLCHDVVEGQLIGRVCLQFKMVGLKERNKFFLLQPKFEVQILSNFTKKIISKERNNNFGFNINAC